MFLRLLELRNFELLPISLPFIGLIVFVMRCCVYHVEGHFKTITPTFIVVELLFYFSFLYKRKGVTSRDSCYPIGCQILHVLAILYRSLQ